MVIKKFLYYILYIMSLNQIINDNHVAAGWKNIRCNDLIVDGDIVINNPYDSVVAISKSIGSQTINTDTLLIGSEYSDFNYSFNNSSIILNSNGYFILPAGAYLVNLAISAFFVSGSDTGNFAALLKNYDNGNIIASSNIYIDGNNVQTANINFIVFAEELINLSVHVIPEHNATIFSTDRSSYISIQKLSI